MLRREGIIEYLMPPEAGWFPADPTEESRQQAADHLARARERIDNWEYGRYGFSSLGPIQEAFDRASAEVERGWTWPPEDWLPEQFETATDLLEMYGVISRYPLNPPPDRFSIGAKIGSWRWLPPGVDLARPVLLDTMEDGKHLWSVDGVCYSTFENLTSDEVTALLSEKENRARAKVAKAVAAMEQAERLAEPGRRSVIPDDVKVFVWRRDQGQCVRCGSPSELEFDHIIPLAMGGANTERNLQLLCAGCNRAKGGNLA
jgi:hypothetical protein